MQKRLAMLVLTLLAACESSGGDHDLGTADLAVPDLAAGGADLASPPDLTMADLEPPPDLTTPPDLTPAAPTEMFISDWNHQAVYAFPIGAGSMVAPTRTISGTSTGFALPSYLAVHGEELFVADKGNILVFHTTDDGNVAPVRTLQVITGSPGQSVNEIRIDGTTLYVAIPTSLMPGAVAASVRAYDISAQGTDAPLRTITGTTTNIRSAHALAIDNGYLYEGEGSAINVFLTGDNGDVAPQRTITSSSNVFSDTSSLVVVGTELFAAVAYTTNFVSVFPTNASGDTTPSRVMTGIGSEWQMTAYAGDLYLCDWYQSQLEIFPTSTNGSIASAVSTLTSASLSHPNGVVLH